MKAHKESAPNEVRVFQLRGPRRLIVSRGCTMDKSLGASNRSGVGQISKGSSPPLVLAPPQVRWHLRHKFATICWAVQYFLRHIYVQMANSAPYRVVSRTGRRLSWLRRMLRPERRRRFTGATSKGGGSPSSGVGTARRRSSTHGFYVRLVAARPWSGGPAAAGE